jgi:hypothetical protein
MKYLKYIFECVAYGTVVALVVHGMVVVGTWLTIGVWLNEGGKYWYVFIASVAMFGCLYAFFDSLNAKIGDKKWYQYKFAPYLLVALFVVFPAIVWGVYKLNYSGPLKLTVIEERQPLFVEESDGAIENKYVLKLVNETGKDIHVSFNTTSDLKDLIVVGAEAPLLVHHGKVNRYTIFIKVPGKNVTHEVNEIYFQVRDIENPTVSARYKTAFNGPKG